MRVIRVGVEGKFFTLNGQRKVLRMRSSFATMSYLDHWALGYGGKWIDMTEDWFERCKEAGFDGVRVFGETTGWMGDHPFFGKIATSPFMWDYGALRRNDRPRELTLHNQKMIRELIRLLQKHGLICEYVTDATLKGLRDRAGIIGHCIRQTARFFRHLEEQENINIFHELHNEWDAHNKAGLDLNELHLQFTRHRRYKNGEPEQWPRGIVGVSHGGKNEVDYNVGRPGGADYVALHPERHGNWWTHTNLEQRYKHLPRYYNESKHYCSPEEYYEWVETGPFSQNSSTHDLPHYLEFMNRTLSNDISFCVHDLVGMGAGYFDEARLPLTPLEEELTPSPPPSPEPPPEPPPKKESWWEKRWKDIVRFFGWLFGAD